jgi:phospholipase/carboxylesterase
MDLMHAVHVPAGKGPFPTLVALHGWGANAHDLLGLAPYLHGGEALVICPQGPVEVPVGPGTTGYGWFPLIIGSPPDPAEFGLARERLAAFVEAAIEHYPVDPRKLVVAGFSQGGVMAYDMALRDPERFAGLVALSSWLREEIADAIGPQPGIGSLPIFVSHGTRDPMISVDSGRESRDRLIAMGASPTYREYDMEHGIGGETLRDLVQWLDDKVLRSIALA